MSKTFKIVGNDISDGYHTFDELYEHRVLLYLNLCVLMKDKASYKVEDESYGGWFVLYLETERGQISYHLPSEYLSFCKDNFNDWHPEFDGHTSKIVADRLYLNMKALKSFLVMVYALTIIFLVGTSFYKYTFYSFVGLGLILTWVKIHEEMYGDYDWSKK